MLLTIIAMYFGLCCSLNISTSSTLHQAMFSLHPLGDSSELDEIHHSVRPFAPHRSDPPYSGKPPSPPATTESTQQTHSHLSHPPPEDPLGPLPDNWEMAYTENGEVYFIE